LWPPSHRCGWLGGGPPAALARNERTRGVEYDEAKMLGLAAMAVVAQGGPATYASGQARGIADGGVLRRPRQSAKGRVRCSVTRRRQCRARLMTRRCGGEERGQWSSVGAVHGGSMLGSRESEVGSAERRVREWRRMERARLLFSITAAGRRARGGEVDARQHSGGAARARGEHMLSIAAFSRTGGRRWSGHRGTLFWARYGLIWTLGF
jgi:hypothetical protein